MSTPILSKLLPISDLFGKIGGLIDALHTSTEEKLAASLKLAEARQAFELEMAKVDTEFAKMQAQVITAEAQGHSWLQRNWRPLSMLAFVAVILHQYVLGPIFGLRTATVLPDDLWSVIQIGFGGYIVGRTVEKAGPKIAEALKK